MKILTIISKLEMGGIEKTLLSCLPYFKSRGIEMHILCTVGGELDSEFIKQGVTLIDFGKYKKPFFDAVKLYKVLKKGEYDVVHSRYGHTSGIFATIGKLLNIPVFVSVHNEKAMFMLNLVNKPIFSNFRMAYLTLHKHWTVKYATKIVGHSQANLSYFTKDWKCNYSKYTVVYNGVDFSKFENTALLNVDKSIQLETFVKGASKVLIHIGSFKEQKNHEFLINVFGKLNPIENNFKLILLGTGSLKSKIEEIALEKELQSHIYFVGMDSNITPYLALSDIFFFPSLYEGFGNVLIEAQYMKLPICASGIAPHYEAAYKGYQKFFFDPSNESEALNKLQNLILKLNSGDLNFEIEEAYEFAKQFSIEKMAENLVNLFEDSKI
ncbi:glycosyltransferase [Flavobacterium aquicola]|uniref:Glycosyltransferase involved in cell wall biosynthesis n=1 Tax=Flavobacterium aquicola TaxID=1682742 RepID=A0A3E0EKH5_9FLAO|nr:glycosyltransferase [Flavobacterium aquicola]REG98243.1 glycosyltransferase involved in cell wall biosynthesis [Flavobacterium aquicola]